MSGKSRISDGAPAADDYALVLAQERLVLEAQVAIQRLLRRAGLKQSDLADLLDVSEARVSQMFSEGAKNLTLRTLARIFHVLGARCRIVEDAEIKAVSAATRELPVEVAVAPGPPEPATAAEVADGRVQPEGETPRAADAWLLGGRDIFDMLSEDAPFASSIVWVSDQRIVPANENHPSDGAHGRRGAVDARRWASQDRYAFG